MRNLYRKPHILPQDQVFQRAISREEIHKQNKPKKPYTSRHPPVTKPFGIKAGERGGDNKPVHRHSTMKFPCWLHNLSKPVELGALEMGGRGLVLGLMKFCDYQTRDSLFALLMELLIIIGPQRTSQYRDVLWGQLPGIPKRDVRCKRVTPSSNCKHLLPFEIRSAPG